MPKATNLLINEPPLQVLPTLAKQIGLNEAIVIQQIHYWLSNPKAGVERNGYKWIFNTYEEWHANFPFWSVSTIQRIFTTLEKIGLIVAEQLDAAKRDMRKYYRIDYDQLAMMDDSNLTSSIMSTCYDGSHQNDTMLNSNTETTSETTTETTAVVVVPEKNIFEVFEQEIGPLTPILADMLDDIDKTYPAGWFERGVKEARRCTTRVTLAYVEKILQRWKAEGFNPLPPKEKPKDTGPIEVIDQWTIKVGAQ